jgi:hypothetical protein
VNDELVAFDCFQILGKSPGGRRAVDVEPSAVFSRSSPTYVFYV